MLAGVSGGLARYFEIHPAVFRVGFVVLTLLGGAGILIYAAAALVMPDEGKEDSIATAALRNRRDRPWPLIGLGLLAVAGAILLSRATLWPDGDSWWLFLIAGVLILWITRQPAADAGGGREGARRRATRAACDAALRRLAIVVASLVALVRRRRRDLHGRVRRATSAAASATARTSVTSVAGPARRLPARDRHARARPQQRAAARGRDARRGARRRRRPAGDRPGRRRAARRTATAEVGQVELPGGIGDDGRNADSDLTETGDRVLVLDARRRRGAGRGSSGAVR